MQPPASLQRQTSTVSSRRSKVDEDGEEIVVAGCFTRNVMRCPCAFMWGVFVLAIVLSALPMLSGRVVVDPMGDAGWITDTIREHRDYKTWTTIQAQYGPFEETPPPPTNADPTYDPPPVDLGADLSVDFVYEALDTGVEDNMITVEAISKMEIAETKLLEMEGWSTHCAKAYNFRNASDIRCSSPVTLLNILHPNDALQQKQCEEGFCYAPWYDVTCQASDYGVFPCTSTIYDWRDGTRAAKEEWASLLTTRLCGIPGLKWQKTTLLEKSAECTATKHSSKYVRSRYQVYSPFNNTESENFGSEDGDRHKFADEEPGKSFVKKMAKALDKARDEVSATKSTDSQRKTGGTINMWWSAPWSGYPDIMVLLNTDLTLGAISLLLIFVIILLNTTSLLLTLAGLFEIMVSIPLAMFLWMLCGQRTVSIFELLGLFLILCIGADDIFVFTDTWKESAVMPPAISGSIASRFTWTYNRAAGAMLTTTATTAFCLLLNATAPFPAFRTFGIFNAFIVICDYVMVITWYAATTVGLTQLTAKVCPPGSNFEFSCCCPGKGGEQQKKERKITALFRDKLAPITYKLRWPLILSSAALIIGGIVATTTLFADGEPQPWTDGHQYQSLLDIQAQKFGDPDEPKLTTTLIYGLQDRSVEFPTSVDLFQQMRDGWDDKFTLKFKSDDTGYGPKMQEKMVKDCEVLRAKDALVTGKEAYCLLNDLKAYDPANFPYDDQAKLIAALETFKDSQKYAQLAVDYNNYRTLTNYVVGTKPGGMALWHSFNATIPTDVEISTTAIQPYYDEWRDAVDKQVDQDVVLTQKEILFVAMAGFGGIQRTAVLNIVIALVCSYFVLVLVTRNALVPVLAVISIGATVSWVLAATFSLGFKFDLYTGILIVMIVGMAVDYAVHFTHFYNEAEGTRYDKAQGALHGVGVSVVGGAVTTAGAAIPLIFAPNFQFFHQAGVFIFCVAFFGLIFSFFLLIPLLMVCGPEGETGDVIAIYRKLRGTKPDKDAKAFTAQGGGNA